MTSGRLDVRKRPCMKNPPESFSHVRCSDSIKKGSLGVRRADACGWVVEQNLGFILDKILVEGSVALS